jgi:hypothetical protein
MLSATALTGTPAGALGQDAVLCENAILFAAAQTGAPVDLLQAIALVESGRGGRLWPWAINAKGAGRWHESRAALVANIRNLREAGETSFDIGCFQINTHWHGTAFDNDEAMADPATNALYAAQFLSDLKQEFGTWEGAAGAYHSRTPQLADAYRARVLGHLRPAEATLATAAPAPAPVPPKPFDYPLFLAGASGAPGSIVPAQDARQPFLAGWGTR